MRSFGIPFQENGGKLRGLIDLMTGCYPKFIFCGSIGDILPVFHFHEVSPEGLEPTLLYLYENGYRTVTSEEISRFVRSGKHPGPFTIALCFDDAWASLWTVAAPLLRKYGFSGIAYAIPSRIAEAKHNRPTLVDGIADPTAVDISDTPFVTWSELRSLHNSGVFDIQCHTFSHSMVFCIDKIIDFVTPKYKKVSLLSRPMVTRDGKDSYLTPSDLGSPIYPQRSRMSNGLRFVDEEATRCRLTEYVKSAGGEEFFFKPDWKRELYGQVKISGGEFESATQHEKALYDELSGGRAVLNERLGTNTVQHICFPWGIAGESGISIAKKVGYVTAFADRMFGMRAVRAGDNPFRLMRLPNRYIYCLPRRGRRIFSLSS